MDLMWFTRYRKSGGDHGFIEWDLATDVEGYEQVSAPAQDVLTREPSRFAGRNAGQVVIDRFSKGDTT